MQVMLPRYLVTLMVAILIMGGREREVGGRGERVREVVGSGERVREMGGSGERLLLGGGEPPE